MSELSFTNGTYESIINDLIELNVDKIYVQCSEIIGCLYISIFAYLDNEQIRFLIHEDNTVTYNVDYENYDFMKNVPVGGTLCSENQEAIFEVIYRRD